MEYRIKSYPTLYNGRMYRSRLEARWAAFFDLVGWTHEYEPFDLGEWSPDFLIRTETLPILVEVKPIHEFNEAVAERMSRAARKAEFRMILLLGASPFTDIGEGGSYISSIGWFGTLFHPYPFLDFQIADWFPAELAVSNEAIDIRWGGLESTTIFDSRTKEEVTSLEHKATCRVWAEATNYVQWKGVANGAH